MNQHTSLATESLEEGLHVLCLSRSYLSRLLPAMGARHEGAIYHHIVQNDREARAVADAGGLVAMNLQEVVRQALKVPNGPIWEEPDDMRAVTGFDWCPIQSDRYLPQFTPAQRRRIAGALQLAVKELFEARHYTGFVSEPVALFITHLLYYHCKKAGTRPLLWCNTYYPGDFYFADGTEISSPMRRHARPQAEVAEVVKTIHDYAHGVVGDRAGPVYHHAFSGVKPSRFAYFRQRRGESPLVLRPGWVSRFIQVARLGRAVLARMVFPYRSDYMTAAAVAEHAFYLRCLFVSSGIYDAMPEIASADNVVYPLQYEPEASLLYFAPHIVSQLSFVETVLRALPPGKVLWVKEHPNQFGALGQKGWQAMKRRYPNLRFVHGRQSGRELIKRAGLVVTITSTMGLDGLLLGKHVLVAGKVFYAGFAGAVRVQGYPELALALNNPAYYTASANLEQNVAELAAFASRSYPGDPQPSAILYSEENLARLVSAVRQELVQEEGADVG